MNFERRGICWFEIISHVFDIQFISYVSFREKNLQKRGRWTEISN
jgi:hypothetical protein